MGVVTSNGQARNMSRTCRVVVRLLQRDRACTPYRPSPIHPYTTSVAERIDEWVRWGA